MHANLCLHILASTCQDGGNPFPVIRLPVVNCETDSSRHTLLQPALHSQWSRQVYIRQQSITGFLVVQEPICTHAHEYRLLGASCYSCAVAAWVKVSAPFFFFLLLLLLFLFFLFLVSHLCMQIYASPPIFIIIQRRIYKEKQFFVRLVRESNSRPLDLQSNALSTRLQWHASIFNCKN